MPCTWMRTFAACFLLSFTVLLGGGCAGDGSSGQNSPPVTSLSVTSVSPSTLQAGSGDTIVTLNGTKFTSASVAAVGGMALPTTYVSSSELAVLVPAAQVAAAGSLPVTVSDAGVTSGAVSLSVTNPAPVITAISPSSLPPGLSSALVTVQGTGFVAASVGQVNGTGRTTVVNSATQITMTLNTADLAAAGTLLLSVANAAPGGGASAGTALNVNVASTTAEPTLTGYFPATLETAAPTTTLYATGANFTAGCKVLWDGQALNTTLTQTSQSLPPQLLAQLPPTAIAVAGAYTMAVACAQATTAPLTVAVVDPPAPQIVTDSSPAIPVRTDSTFTITGSDFTTRSVAQFNGAAIATTVVDNQHLSVTVPAAQIQAPGNYSLQVITAGPGGGTSTTFGLTGYMAVPNIDMVYNPADGLAYASTPSDAPSPYAWTVVSVNPATGEIATPFGTSSMTGPTRLALSSDGKDLWVAEEDNYQIAEFDMATKKQVYTNDYSTYPGMAVTALVAIPGDDGAVALASYGADYGATLQIDGPDYTIGGTIIPPRPIDAMAVNGATKEIYALAGDTYLVYTYGPGGLTLKFSNQLYEGFEYASLTVPAVAQFVGGLLYTQNAAVFNPETGQPVGPTFLGPGLSDSDLGTPHGAMFADAMLGKIFFVPGVGYGAGSVYVFNLTTGAFITNDISVALANSPLGSQLNAYPSGLARWGANGLVFRNEAGVYSVQSPLVGAPVAAAPAARQEMGSAP